MAKKKKPLAEIHLQVNEDDINNTPMVINGTGQELATLLIISFAKSEQFYDVAKAAVTTFEEHKLSIKSMYNK